MELLALVLFGGIVSTFIYYLIFIPWKNVKKFSCIPSPKTIPVLGNAIELMKGQYEFNKVVNHWASVYGTRLCVWGSYWFPLVVLGNAKDVKKVLQSRDHVQKGMFYKALDYTIGTGAFNSPVPIWKQRRPHLEKAFHSKLLNKYPKVFDECSRTFVEILKTEVGDGRVFDIHPYANFCSMEMLIEGAFDLKVNIQRNRNNPVWQKVVHAYERCTYLTEYRMLRPWLLLSEFLWNLSPFSKEIESMFDWSRDNVLKPLLETKRAIRNKMKSEDQQNQNFIENPGKIHLGFLDLLLELQQTNKELNLTDLDLIYEMNSLYIAGHDATGKSISFTILYLGFYPECQAKVIEEMDKIFGDDRDREITEEDLGKMRYLECCIKESLRLMPPVSFITRKVGSDVHLDEDAIISKGTEVAIAIYLVHRDETIYPNPEEFQPERFSPENSQGRNPYAWIPFSAGPRNCLGQKFAMMENKTVLANIFRNFRVESVGDKTGWVLNTNVTLKLEGGWNIKLINRC